MNAGDIAALKKNSFCHFEYLLAKLHSSSVRHLVLDLQTVCAHVMDAELYLLLRCITKSLSILNKDPVQLANELIGRLRPLKGEFVEDHFINNSSALDHS